MIAYERRSAHLFAGLQAGARERRGAMLATGAALVGAIALVDYATGYEVRLAILYLAPITVLTWTMGWRAGAAAALASSLAWTLTFHASHPYSSIVFFYWEAAATCASFLVFVALLSRVRSAMERDVAARHRDAVHRSARLVALGESASAIAHELNQPLAAIAAYNNACLRLLDQGAADPNELRETMQKCRDQATRAGAIIQRLREVLRQPVPQRTPQDLNELARAALGLVESQARESGVRVELQLASELPRVRADHLLIEQVIFNLLRNAIEAVQALPAERRRITLATHAQTDGDATLRVEDLGDGVPHEMQGRLFEAFATTKPGGLGLGLSICRSVVESLGGAIRHEAKGGPGARFALTLPGEHA